MFSDFVYGDYSLLRYGLDVYEQYLTSSDIGTDNRIERTGPVSLFLHRVNELLTTVLPDHTFQIQ